jgi:hypothetical protein
MDYGATSRKLFHRYYIEQVTCLRTPFILLTHQLEYPNSQAHDHVLRKMVQGSVARGGRNSEMVSTARGIQEITRWRTLTANNKFDQ